MRVPFVGRVVGLCGRHAKLVVLVALAAGVAAGFYSVNHFRMNTNVETLISANAPWRQRQIAFDAAFPQQHNVIVAVVDGATPERAEEGAAALAAALAQNKYLFPLVRRPDANAFFEHDGLMLLPLADVKSSMDQLIAAQPFLGALASDPSLRGIMDSLSTALLGVIHGQTKLGNLAGPLSAFSATLNTIADGKPAFMSWRSMVTGGHPGLRETRRFIQIKPRLNFDALEAGADATAVIRATVARLHLTPDQGVRVRLTGSVPMADEEFATLAEHAGWMALLMMSVVVAMLWLAVHSLRLIFAILLAVLTGLAITMAIGLLFIGAFNVISVAFIALFVGLGVDFGIQFCVRYRAERHMHDDLDAALQGAGIRVGGALMLAAVAIAAGFLSFLPTSYAGVAELGFVAGTGMLVTFALSITFLPALLKLLRPGGEPDEIGFRQLAPFDGILTKGRAFVIAIAVLIGIGGLVLLPELQFDFNPLDLRSPKVESVATALDLMKNPETSPNTINVLAPTHEAEEALLPRLAALPQVSQVLTIDTFVPTQQKEKLALIADAASLLDTTLDPFMTKPPPSDAEVVASMQATAQQLLTAAGSDKSQAASDARSLAAALRRLAHGSPELRAQAAQALVPGLQTMLAQAAATLQPQPVTIKSLPPDLVQDWIAPNGAYRIQVSPTGDANNNAVLRRFTAAVRTVAPSATGTPISIQEAGNTIVRAFVEAGILSFLSIAILLAIALRKALDVALALVPLLLAGIETLATCVVIGLPLNYANIIALPLLFGIGVAFDIYFVMAWRAGSRNLLQSPLTRAVILSAGTTASAFGTLWLSSHPGTASMGQLLAISLAWILATVLFLLPALLEQFAPNEGLSRAKS
jgi:uncharacterized protein